MADVQVENGFVQVATQLADAFYKNEMTGTEHSVIWWIIRNTYGWKRKDSVFSLYGIAKDCNRNRNGIRKAVASLTTRGIIKIVSGKIGLNKDFEKWSLPVTLVTCHPGDPVTTVTPPLSLQGQVPSIGKKYINIPRVGTWIGFDQFWTSFPKHKAKADAIKAWNNLQPDSSLLTTILKALDHQKAEPDADKNHWQFFPLPASWLRGRRWEDEVKTTSTSKFERLLAAKATHNGKQEDW